MAECSEVDGEDEVEGGGRWVLIDTSEEERKRSQVPM